jgi:hypothetical protein
MKWKEFQDLSKCFSVVLFVQEGDWEHRRSDVEKLGKQRNVILVVQPCPYEGVEFLARVGHDLVGSMVSTEKDLFWHAIVLDARVSKATFTEVSKQHHEYLCAILEQDAHKVGVKAKLLRSYIESYS